MAGEDAGLLEILSSEFQVIHFLMAIPHVYANGDEQSEVSHITWILTNRTAIILLSFF